MLCVAFRAYGTLKKSAIRDQRARENAWKEVESLVSICKHGIDLDTSLII